MKKLLYCSMFPKQEEEECSWWLPNALQHRQRGSSSSGTRCTWNQMKFPGCSPRTPDTRVNTASTFPVSLPSLISLGTWPGRVSRAQTEVKPFPALPSWKGNSRKFQNFLLCNFKDYSMPAWGHQGKVLKVPKDIFFILNLFTYFLVPAFPSAFSTVLSPNPMGFDPLRLQRLCYRDGGEGSEFCLALIQDMINPWDRDYTSIIQIYIHICTYISICKSLYQGFTWNVKGILFFPSIKKFGTSKHGRVWLGVFF